MDRDFPSFSTWRGTPDTTPEQRLAAIVAHARFQEAARQVSRNMLALAAHDRALDSIVKDAGRFFATGLAVYLHASGGLTLARIKEICSRMGIASPGRARAILLFLRFLRLVEPVGGERRAGLYAPTAELTRVWASHIRAGMEAAQILEPEIVRLSNRLGDPDVLRRLIRIQGEIGIEAIALGSREKPLWRVFLNRHAGTQILHALMQSAAEAGDYPPAGDLAYSPSQLARRFNVSRPHVSRMLRAAEQDGLVITTGENTLRLTPDGLREVTHLLGVRLSTELYAAMLLYDELASIDSPETC